MAKYLATVRCGLMAEAENYFSDVEGLQRGQTVIVNGARGVDFGVIGSAVSLLDREVKGLGEILRVASPDDIGIIRHIQAVKEPEELAYCTQRVQERSLPMKLAGVEHLFGGDKIIFYFLADGRVDFRELVKDLARRYRTRIEMRQIGVRDEARLLADYEHCGQELCCRTFIRNLEPVTMRMAKMQKTTLDPTKISGHCGRLMCCLRFEDDVYNQLRAELPNKGDRIRVGKIEGEVINQNILAQQVTIQSGDGTRTNVKLEEISERCGRCRGNKDGGGCGGHRHRNEGRPQNPEADEPAPDQPTTDTNKD